MERINGYQPLREFTSVGAGTASWTVAEKNGREYFLKRFNTPKYTPACYDLCREYEWKKNALYTVLRNLDNGNLVVIDDFFHWDTFYYIATQLIHESSVTAEEIYSLPQDKRLILMKTLAHCFVQLEKGGIVHADLKPTNVMIKPTVSGFYSLKLIDFDSSFFVSDPPVDSEDLEGDMTYMAPEVLMGMCGENVKLSCKVDVFAMGLMFHQFLCGSLPMFDRENYNCACEAVANGETLRVNHTIPDAYRPLIISMLEADPDLRPTFATVFRTLSNPGAAEPPLIMPGKKEPAGTAATGNPWMRKAGRL